MRCYFHLVNDREFLADPFGIEVTDLAMAHTEALRAIEELLQEGPAQEQDLICWKVPPLASSRGIGPVERAEQTNLVLKLRNARVA